MTTTSIQHCTEVPSQSNNTRKTVSKKTEKEETQLIVCR